MGVSVHPVVLSVIDLFTLSDFMLLQDLFKDAFFKTVFHLLGMASTSDMWDQLSMPHNSLISS